jgi:NAD(P)-dependent dehydrogenase (short-subunit alcohol dehydrogenase family)
MSLLGKRVVVVGGSSGIGFSTAKAFLDESAGDYRQPLYSEAL